MRAKLWSGTCPSKSEITYTLTAQEEAEIVRWDLSFKERDHVHSDGTRRGRNHEVGLVLQRARSRTNWWHTKRPKSWGGSCPSKSEITYTLMAHKEADIVRGELSFKERDHVHSDGTQRGRNREVRLVLQRVRSRWWDRISPMHITTHVRHFCDDLGRFALKDDKGRQGTTHFATICNVLYHSTILYSAPFHFCDLFWLF